MLPQGGGYAAQAPAARLQSRRCHSPIAAPVCQRSYVGLHVSGSVSFRACYRTPSASVDLRSL